MKRNTLFSFLTIAALGLLTAGPASADTFTWNGSVTSGWQTPGNWDLDNGSYPQSGDIAIIPNVATNDPVIDVRDEVVTELRIQRGGLLTITGKKLTLDGAVTHDINGDLVLSNSSSKLEFSTNDGTVDGGGAIIGQDNSAEIRIADNKTLTNEMVIRGKLTILDAGSTGTFLNGSTGTVNADAAGVLELDNSLSLQDECGADWKATHASATLLFEATSDFVYSDPNLRGDFVLSNCSTIDFDGQDVKTSGSFASPSGHIVNVSGKFFYLDDGTCESPTSYTEVTGSQSFGGC